MKLFFNLKTFFSSLLILSLLVGCDKNPLGDGDTSLIIDRPTDEVPATAPTISYTGSTGTSGTINQAMSVSPTTLSNNGSAITGCTISPALPAGLSINNTTCVISGTPTVTLTSTAFTVTATNSAGSNTGTVNLTVSAAVPTISYTGSTGTSGTINQAMSVSPTTLSNNGSAITGCTISPALPAGLSINNTTCVISGTPTVTLTSTAFTVTATNSAGSNTGTVNLTVSAAVPTISYTGSTGTSGTINQAMSVSPTTLSNNGSAITGCTISPALPAGLSINNITCVISGTPTVTLTSTAFTVTVTNSAGSSNGSVTLSVAQACPTNYIPVPHNTALGTTQDFCVAKYEMKNVSSVATSQATGAPWVSINQTNAKTACTNLGAGYNLISNPQWMTLARNVELIGSNWSSGTAGTGVLARGHSDNNPSSAQAASVDDLLGYTNTGNNSGQAGNSGWEQRRTHTLSNGEVIWDLAGNVWEWVDWQVTPARKAYDATDGAPVGVWREWRLIDRFIGENGIDEMRPETWASSYIIFSAGIPDTANSLTGASNGLGQYYAGNKSSGGAVLRGGNWNHGSSAGIFAVDLYYAPSSTHAGFGFRCVFQP